ncbi:MoaD/ThiS family protein [Acinetobacter terrestris]|jgi:sulfur carrier protein ThiS|uniref:MoaD/ThiS family protein n=1 Tax=Acinetobacter terrestris TaxID=2529843 RepID=A0AAW6UTS6_9GAMM|nr:MoaD/ThiS family protein [Acinetobacter terrestris]MDK1683029.1 MoaD/ThiS family protein [Acinetobacter terrestris]TCB55674.1 MoaD/ThiS family protein [Acinetobacter terrestris]
MPQIKIKIEAFGAVERQLPQNLEIICSPNSTVSDILDQVTQQCPAAFAMIERCACAIGEDIIPRQSKLNSDSTLVLLSPVAGG